MTSPHITSVYGSAEAEYTIKKSRFLAHLKEVSSKKKPLLLLKPGAKNSGMPGTIVTPIRLVLVVPSRNPVTTANLRERPDGRCWKY